MIVDELKNAGIYLRVLPGFKDAMEFALSLKDADCGRYDCGGHYVLIQRGETRPLTGINLEAHRRYADLQIVLSGAERIGYAPISSLDIVQTYDAEKDVLFAAGDMSTIDVREGMFYLMLPNDAHAPCGHPGAPASYKKAIVKIRL